MSAPSSWFQRYLMPGFAFKAVVIGGGYATGRELTEFFLPSGPIGGVLGMVLSAAIWSVVCVATFVFAYHTHARDYRQFFRQLLGPGWIVFELVYAFLVVLILAVFGAAAGEIAEALLGWPKLAGSLCLMGAIAAFAMFGSNSVERLFKYVTFIIYGTYALFVVLALSRFGGRILEAFTPAVPVTGWVTAGLSYAGYNIIGAVVILPVMRHLTSKRDAVIAGLLSGPLAIVPALLFFFCMLAFYPEIGSAVLPSDHLLERLELPVFRVAFQLMILSALLEGGAGVVHAINERIAHAYHARRGLALSNRARLVITLAILVASIFIADQFGLVELIAKGYRALSYMIWAIYIIPLLSYGLWRLYSARAVGSTVNSQNPSGQMR